MATEEKLGEAIEILLRDSKTEDINKKIRRNKLVFGFLIIDFLLHALIIFILL